MKPSLLSLFLLSAFVGLSISGFCPIVVDVNQLNVDNCNSTSSTINGTTGFINITNSGNGTAVAWFKVGFLNKTSMFNASVLFSSVGQPSNQILSGNTTQVLDLASFPCLRINETVTLTISSNASIHINVTVGYLQVQMAPNVTQKFTSINPKLVTGQYVAVKPTQNASQILLHTHVTGGMTRYLYGDPFKMPSFPHGCVSSPKNKNLSCLVNVTEIAEEDGEPVPEFLWLNVSAPSANFPSSFSVSAEVMVDDDVFNPIMIANSSTNYKSVRGLFHNIETNSKMSFNASFSFNLFPHTQAFFYIDPLYDLITNKTIQKLQYLSPDSPLEMGSLYFSTCNSDAPCTATDCHSDLKRAPLKPNSLFSSTIAGNQTVPSFQSVFFDKNASSSISFNLVQCSQNNAYSNAYVVFAIQSTDLTLESDQTFLAFDNTYLDFNYTVGASAYRRRAISDSTYNDTLTITLTNSSFSSACLYPKNSNHSFVMDYCTKSRKSITNSAGSASLSFDISQSGEAASDVEVWTIKLEHSQSPGGYFPDPTPFTILAQVVDIPNQESGSGTGSPPDSGMPAWEYAVLGGLALLIVVGVVGAVGVVIYLKKKRDNQLNDEEVLISSEEGYGFDDD